MTNGKTTKRGRDSESGKFIPIDEAKRRPRTTEIETIPVRRPTPPTKRK